MLNQYPNYIYAAGAILATLLLAWIFMRSVQKNRRVHLRDASLTVEELEAHARNMSLKHAVSLGTSRLNWPMTRMNDNFSLIRLVYEDLNKEISKKHALPPAAEWLLDNYYVIEEQVSGLRKDLSRKSYFELPVLKTGAYKGVTRIFALAMELVAHTHGRIEEETLLKYMEAYQSNNILLEREIYAMPAMLRMALLENMRAICEDILETRKQWDLADETVEKWLEKDPADTESIAVLFTGNGRAIEDAIDTGRSSYVEHLFYRLRRSGRRYSDVLRYIDERLETLDTTTEIIAQKEHDAQALLTVSMGNCIVSLKYINSMNWTGLFDAASYLERVLQQDPVGDYGHMDVNSRFYYKSRIERAAKAFGVSELYVAKEALALAREGMPPAGMNPDDDIEGYLRHHIGYYIVGDGRKELAEKQKGTGRILFRIPQWIRVHRGILYMVSIVVSTVLLTIIPVSYVLRQLSGRQLFFAALTAVVVIIPVSEIVISVINWLVCRVKTPAVFSRLELKDGIPDKMSTMVVIPALLSDRSRVSELMEHMENHYLGNREKNLYFALIGAFMDSDQESNKGDTGVIREASEQIIALNRKYADGKKDIFYFYNRQRMYNEIDDNWTGWERKRGALMEFNALLLGSEETSFSFASSMVLPDKNIKYVITLDADTVLPLGMAKKMIGTMAHPLNRPVIDNRKGIVTKGYGLMQPRVSFDSDSSNRSVFARIYTGQEGLDPYASAISDVYQDLFDEGIFTGKGIYDLRVFQSVLEGKLPENAILSHDLLEGSFVRAALVSDLELVDAYPSRFNSFMARLHRWIRGDWQLIPWMRSKVHTPNSTAIRNPLSYISRWKMADNLRRSLLTPSVMVLIFLGFSILPGSGGFWAGLGIASIGLPLILSLITQIFTGGFKRDIIKRHLPGFFGIKASIFQFLLSVVFLPYQAYVALDAIVVTLIRVFFTRKNMLEWVTSSDADRAQPNSLKSYISAMAISVIAGAAAAALAMYFKPQSMLISFVLIPVWLFSPVIAYLVSRDDHLEEEKLDEEDLLELRKTARKTWRYFEEFSNLKDNYLVPDNYQEEPYNGIAHKTSPTNIGLGLMASLTARDMGYAGLIEMTRQISGTVTTIEKMDKWNGHLYNWYDTRTLEALHPIYISTVDSGNLICYLTTLEQGMKEYGGRPLIDAAYIRGLNDTIRAGMEAGEEFPASGGVSVFAENPEETDPVRLSTLLEDYLLKMSSSTPDKAEWKMKSIQMAKSLQREISCFFPWVLLYPDIPDNDLLTEKISVLKALIRTNTDLRSLPGLGKRIQNQCDLLTKDIQKAGGEARNSWPDSIRAAAESSVRFTEDFIEQYDRLIERISNFSMNTRFDVLYDNRRHLFHIGYNLDENRLSNSYYDLLASEARQTSYIAIARGEIPPKHWFMLGRSLTVVDRFKGLVSWSGTMFEYLMPLLLMRSYKNTLLDETYSFVVKSQMKYGRQREMPWGFSESSYNVLDANLVYQYKAIGVPWLGLKRGLAEDAVVTPYAAFLALMVDPVAAYRNIMNLKGEGLEGTYGFYEAADYTPERLEPHARNVIVRSYMAHHQGMTLLSINNYLNGFTMQHRFAKDPNVKAARLLLQEKVPLRVVFTKDSKEKIPVSKAPVYGDKGSYRRFCVPDFTLPKAHVLSNGKYFVGLTDTGTGYSMTREVAISRWRPDPIAGTYGTFFYIENLDTNRRWSAAYAPLNVMPEEYEVVFTADKAAYRRTDGDIETLMEIVVASGDSAEIRKIRLKNNGETACTLQVTSYLELVAASQGSDLAHPAFSNLFVATEYDSQHNVLLANRRTRSKSEKQIWVAGIPVTEGEIIGAPEYETDRSRFLGRGNSTADPEMIELGKPLSNTSGSVLDPIFSIRTRVRVEPGNEARIFFVTATADSRESITELVEKYNSTEACRAAFWLARTRSQVEARYLDISASDMEFCQDLISDILFISPRRRRYEQTILNNREGQQSLWKHGISGDRPIVLLVLEKIDEIELLYELLKAHEYWRLKDLLVDLVILCREENSYNNPLHSLISEVIYATQTQDVLNLHRDVFMLKTSSMTTQEINLFYASARMIFEGSQGTMEEQYNREVPKAGTGEVPMESGAVQYTGYKNIPGLPVFPRGSQEQEELQFFNGFGGFTKNAKSYVIKLTGNEMTPAPWVNVVANPGFGFMVSESGGGYTWCENSRENKLTKWSNDPVGDEPGEVFYINDETGNLWSMTPLPIREKEPYTVEHGFGYTSFRHLSHGIDQELVQFVPVSGNVKVSMIHLHNETQEKKELSITYYMTPILGVSMTDTGLHLVSSRTPDGTLLIENPYNTEFPGRVCFVDVSIKDRTLTGDRKEFFGSGRMDSPEALGEKPLSGNTGAGYDPCAAVQIRISLKANETADIVFSMGMAGNREKALALAGQFRTVPQARKALQEARDFWSEKLETVKVETPDTAMNIMMNGWLQYQVVSCRMWARSGFYQAGGAFGFRDQLQDCLSLAAVWPDLARDQIIRHAGHQFEEGDVLHWWHEPAGKGTRTRISDDYLWLPFVTAGYIITTADYGILGSRAPYLLEEPLKNGEAERYCRPEVTTEEYTLYDHCIRSVNNALRFGAHGLPLIRGGDWNDGMNNIGSAGQGESVWLGWFLIATLKRMVPLCHKMGDADTADRYEVLIQQITEAVENSSWDGNWYARAFFDDGSPLGTESNAECKIDSLAQTWSVLSGAGDPERAARALHSLENYLIMPREGIIKLLTPPFTDGVMDPGYIRGYLPGVRENGGQYTHAATWVVMALARLGQGDRAWECFRLLNPIYHAQTHREAWVYKVEPYVMAADVYGEHPHIGRGGWTWYTGAAGWMYNAGLESILGFIKQGEQLIFDPNVPQNWAGYSICYTYLQTEYRITVSNPDGVCTGVRSVSVDGILQSDRSVTLVNDRNTHIVEVVMGV